MNGQYSKITAQKILKLVLMTVSGLTLVMISATAYATSTVNLTLTEGDASEAGQVPGSFKVSRTDDGNIASGLNVRVEVRGSAAWDVDYTYQGMGWAFVDDKTFTVPIPGNQLSQTVNLIPRLDNIIEGDESIAVQLLDYGAFYTAPEQNTIDLTIADFREVMFKDSFEDPEP
jgi:hypothetical protein